VGRRAAVGVNEGVERVMGVAEEEEVEGKR
jgi:hypothetical protein